MTDNKSVQVAVRIRPLVPSEMSRGCEEILEVFPEVEQIRIKDSSKAFSYNHVFGPESSQKNVYEKCVQKMVKNIFQGYNLTILAYGQTGSGKTHSMGTNFNGDGEMGIIPRVVYEIFNFARDNFKYNFTITASFMELYQETLYDLLSGKNRDDCTLDIREDATKGIIIPGLAEVPVSTAEEVLKNLMRGSQGRATGCTNMNAQSSRSHAIFTLNLCMQNKNDSSENKMAKLHLVDLAGSERSKKTGAVGTTFKEGVTINKGLLSLGNVISALGDDKHSNGFIPYRDSNLTRLLKDSLGGNSVTLMIACVSPADYNMEETLSTLRYADRARKIINKPIVNQDAKVGQINELKRTINSLRMQLLERGNPEDVIAGREADAMKLKLRDLTVQISVMLSDKTSLLEKAMILQTQNDNFHTKISGIKEDYSSVLGEITDAVNSKNCSKFDDILPKLQAISEKLIELDDDRQRSEAEITDHEHQSLQFGPTTKHDEDHAKIQLDLDSELTEVSKQIAMKEYLARQIQLNHDQSIGNAALAKNQEKLAILEEELLKSSKKNACGKVNDQNRKRCIELERQIHDLKREQARLIKMKENDVIKMDLLRREIVDLKHVKVRLIKSMKETETLHRQKMIKGDRDLHRIKQENSKNVNKIVKMTVMYNKQKNVLQRKIEEAVAVNKRLKDALAVRQKVQIIKNINKTNKIETWMKNELDIFLQLAEAETALKNLLDDRAMLSEQLDKVRNSSEAGDSSAIVHIEEDIEMRSVQIAALQQKILLSDEDLKSKTRFDNIQTMSDAKFALKLCLEKLGEIKNSEVSTQLKLMETQDALNDMTEQKDELEAAMKIVDYKYNVDLTKTTRQHEETMSLVLKQLKDAPISESADQALRERCQFLQEKLETMDNEREKFMQQIYDYQNQMSDLEQKLDTIENLGNKSSHFEGPLKTHNDAEMTPPQASTPSKKRRTMTVRKIDETFVAWESENDEMENSLISYKNDPDWRRTPVGKWLLSKKSDTSHLMRRKRSSDGGCTCTKSNCGNRCGCKRVGADCSAACKCLSNLCTNRRLELSKENNRPEEISSSDTEHNPKSPKISKSGMKIQLFSK